jgi:lysophospholipase L1-like esterase
MTERAVLRMKTTRNLLCLCCCVLSLLSACARPSAPSGAAQTQAATRPAHNFARWEREIAAFEAQDRLNPQPKGGVLFIGSSTIRLWKTLATDFPDTHVINRGFGGSEIVDSTHFADRIIFPYEPRAIFLRAGGNDIHSGRSAREVFEDYKQFVATVHTRLPRARVVFISWCPAISRWSERHENKALNDLVHQYVQQRNTPLLEYVETYDMSLDANGQGRPELFVSDMLHFNEAGYRILAERVRPFVSR